MNRAQSDWTGRKQNAQGIRALSGGSDKEIRQMQIEELKLKFTRENSERLFKEMSESQQCVDFEFQHNDEAGGNRKSLWGLFLDAIQQNPRMNEMKTIIDEAKRSKEQNNDIAQHKMFEKYYTEL